MSKAESSIDNQPPIVLVDLRVRFSAEVVSSNRKRGGPPPCASTSSRSNPLRLWRYRQVNFSRTKAKTMSNTPLRALSCHRHLGLPSDRRVPMIAKSDALRRGPRTAHSFQSNDVRDIRNRASRTATDNSSLSPTTTSDAWRLTLRTTRADRRRRNATATSLHELEVGRSQLQQLPSLIEVVGGVRGDCKHQCLSFSDRGAFRSRNGVRRSDAVRQIRFGLAGERSNVEPRWFPHPYTHSLSLRAVSSSRLTA